MAGIEAIARVSERKPMGAFWAILAVPDHVLGGRRSMLLARMFLLDNGTRGCTASAAILGGYTGLSERSVEKYRGELAARGLVYRVIGTRGWHVNLPSGLPADRAKDPEIHAYMRRIVAALDANASPEHVPGESTPTGGELRQPVQESTPSVVGKYAPHRTDTITESTPSGADSVANTFATALSGLMSTQETHDKSTHDYDASQFNQTHENGNGVSQKGDGRELVREVLDRIEERGGLTKGESVEQKRERFKAMTRQQNRRGA